MAGNASNPPSAGSNYSAGTSSGQVATFNFAYNPSCLILSQTAPLNNLSGTWKWLGASTAFGGSYVVAGLIVRVS
jgi:hypothetical protein